ncbi:hypothetical protein DRJ22_03365 [Candidatus Woesearchaeota archaeon]|nr:MAG: hypothetical protein DRJ22_03365 [Candidatus Woesearchaeota archaeon]
MTLTLYAWLLGTAQIAAVFLSIAAGIMGLSMYASAKQKKYLKSWKPLILVLCLFALTEIIGALKSFGIWSIPWLKHIVPSIMLLFLIAAVIKQINITRGLTE